MKHELFERAMVILAQNGVDTPLIRPYLERGIEEIGEDEISLKSLKLLLVKRGYKALKSFFPPDEAKEIIIRTIKRVERDLRKEKERALIEKEKELERISEELRKEKEEFEKRHSDEFWRAEMERRKRLEGIITDKVVYKVDQEAGEIGGVDTFTLPDVAELRRERFEALKRAEPVEEPKIWTEDFDELLKSYTFETFVVDKNNRFAYSGAQATAKGESAFNPLYISGGTGLGKTHLLAAIGNHIKRERQGVKVVYMSTDVFSHEVDNAIKNNRMDSLRFMFRKVDVLLVDDIHLLANKERLQEEFFYIFNSLYYAKKQIVMTANKLPSEIEGMDERLVSRFEGGLIVDVNLPALRARTIILRNKAEREGIEVPDEVVQLIAERIQTNVRELEGALNKVVAYAKLTNAEISLELADEVLAKVAPKPLRKEIVFEPEEEGVEPTPMTEKSIQKGQSYLIEEDKLSLSLELFAKVIPEYYGLCISRTSPKVIKERVSKDGLYALWLTDVETSEDTISSSLETLIYTIEEQVFSKESVVLLDGIEYLIGKHGFTPVMNFIRQCIDKVSIANSILLVTVNPLTIQRHELKMLEREMNVIKT